MIKFSTTFLFVFLYTQFAIHFSNSLITSTAIFFVAKIESKFFTPKMITIYEGRCLKNRMVSILSMLRNNFIQNLASFDFESVCVPSEELRPTENNKLDWEA